MKILHKRHLFLNTVTDLAQSGAAPLAVSVTEAHPAPPVAAPAAPAAAPAPMPTILQGGAQAPAAAPAVVVPGAAPAVAAAPAVIDPFAWAPEKHRVFNEDKTLNVEATARKVGEAYSAAEKRIGTGDVRPGAVGDYKVTVPEALAAKIPAAELAKSEDFQGFLGKMHEAGLTQKQLDAVTSELLIRSDRLQSGVAVVSDAEGEMALRSAWGADGKPADDQTYRRNVGNAFAAAKAYGGPQFEKLLSDRRYGNDPAILQLLANVGKEMQEDRGASPEAMAAINDSLDALMANPAYTNDRHPEHVAVVGKVNALFAKRGGGGEAKPNNTVSFKS